MNIRIAIICLLFSTVMTAQAQKKVLQIDDFAKWNILENTQISNDGKYISYEINPQQGDGKLVFNELESRRSDTLSRGASAQFTPSSDFLIYRIKVPFDSVKVAKRKKLKEDQMPLDSIGIFSIQNHKTKKFGQLVSFKLPETASLWVPFLLQPDSVKQTKDKIKLNDLVLYQCSSGDTINRKKVTDYFISKNGTSIIFSSYSGDSTQISQVRVFDSQTGTETKLFERNGHVRKLTTSEDGDKFAFLFSPDTTKQKTYALYYAKKNEPPTVVVSQNTAGMPISWAPSENSDLFFSKKGTRLFMGTAHIPDPEPEDSLAMEDKPVLDIWSWTDTEIMSEQKVNLEKEKKRTYLAVYNTDEKKFLQLADPNFQKIDLTLDGDGRMAIGKNTKPYKRESSWTGRESADYYLVDVETGIKRLMLEDITHAEISPQGKFIIWFDPADSCYYTKPTDIYNLQTYSLTKDLPVKFYDEILDTPSDAKPYGIAGWSEDDRYVYIYDRFDIWKIDPTASRVPINISSGYGRKNSLNLRYVKLDPDEKFIPSDLLLIHGFDERNKSAGYFTVETKTIRSPKMLVMDNYLYSDVKKAKNADQLIWRKERCEIYPDLWTSDLSFSHPREISEANPQRYQYNWVRNELIHWTSFSGEELAGILYLPENFDPKKVYPMIVYFYERSSEKLYQHSVPSPSRSTINKTFYASNGYLVFVPDITYQTGYPGQSALNAVISGTSHLINTHNFIDKKRIGIQGQSWGGYQTAYLITQTDMFAAAMAGAPVSNMTSAYGGIRWETGLSRMFQYEHTQSRIGGSLWENPMQYIENSPLFQAPKINTPLLMMHNDKDGAVPWYQGIELFVAMRRLNKPAWLLTYNNEPHNLKKESWENRIDLSIRMKQFFDHYLKGEPMPEWMKYGLPAIDKGKSLGY